MTKSEMRFLRRELVTDVMLHWMPCGCYVIRWVVRLLEFGRYGKELKAYE